MNRIRWPGWSRRIPVIPVAEMDDELLARQFDFWQKTLGPPSRLAAEVKHRDAVVREFIRREWDRFPSEVQRKLLGEP